MDSMSAIVDFFSSGKNEVIRVGDPDAIEKFYKAIIEDGYDLSEMKEILDCDDNLLIESCAGSGKTTTLILKIVRDFLSGKFQKKVYINGIETQTTAKILVSTFLKSGAEDLSDKMDEIIKKYHIEGIDKRFITFKTMHAEVYNALVEMGIRNIQIIDDTTANRFIKKACKDYNIRSVVGKSKELLNEEIGDISCILTYARNRLDNSKYDHPLMAEYGMTEIELKAVLEQFKALKRAAGVSDFEDLEEMLYEGYQINPNVVAEVQRRYEYIYLDEFQDTSQLQYAILRPYLDSAKGYVVLGDSDQVIYSWRGSDVALIQTRFEQDYKPVVKQLTVNRRCKEGILNPIIPSIEQNVDRRKKTLRAGQKGGKVEIIVDGGASYLMKAVRNDLMRSEEVGILGRTNGDLLIPALLLELDGYSSFSLSKSVGLNDRIPSIVIGIMDLLAQRYNEKFESYLKLFLTKYNAYEATKLCDILSTTPEYNIFTLDLHDLEYSAPSLFNILRMLRVTSKYNPETHQFEGDRVKAYLNLLEIMEQDVYNGRTIYAQRARDFIYYMRKIIQEHEKVKDLSFEELYHLFHVEIANSLERKKPQKSKKVKGKDGVWVTEKAPKDKSFVKITTVHDAKGKQWDNVYIWNDVDGCFPNAVGNRTLTKEEFEEERRVHYIAWTRAVNKLTVFTRSDRLDGFLKECDLREAEIIELGENKSRRGAKSAKSVLQPTNESEVSETPVEKKVETKDWKWYVKEYYKKYTSYSYICTPKGSDLDICLTKLDGLENLVNKLEEYSLGSYPASDLESVISDILEQLANSL